MHLLTNTIKDYAWGSRTDIAALIGRAVPAPGPEAELWLGAHPAGPSRLADDGRSLVEVISADPRGQLGPETVDRFGERLPYLLKLIAVARPLSLQVHPSAEQAVDGHARGVYGDPWPKPELVCALTPFTALAGFRAAEQAAMLVDRLGVPALDEVVSLLETGDFIEALRALLGLRAIGEKVSWAASAVHHPDYELVTRLARLYPDDPACLAPLLLRRHELQPGEALFLGAGVLHCYLKGFGVEIMGGSDNVMRAGLTPKPIDVDELLRITDPDATPLPVEAADGVYATPSAEFRLRRLAGEGEHRLAEGLPRIVLCTVGSATVGSATAGAFRLRGGDSAFISAAEPGPVVQVSGTVFCAEPGPGAISS